MTFPSRTWIQVLEELSQQADTAHCLANKKTHPSTPLKVVFQAPIKKPIRKSELTGLFYLEIFLQDRDCMGQTQSFGISVKINLQFDIFDRVVLGGSCVHLSATAGHPAVQCWHFEVGEQREKHACCHCEN